MSNRTTLPFRTKFFYGLGEVGEGVKTAALETFLFFYYVQVIGLSGSLAGLALMAALLADAITDPMVGTWSDRTKTSLGRRHPFLYAAPIPLAICLYLLFSPPEGSQLFLSIWLMIFTIAARFAMTFYFIPHMALGAELTDNYKERIALGGYRTLFGYIGRISVLALAFGIFFVDRPGYPNGQFDPSAYSSLALAAGLIVIVSVFISALGTQKPALFTRAMKRPVVTGHGAPFRTLSKAMRTPSFRAMFISLIIMYLYNGVQFALALHLNTYFWELPPQTIQFVLYANIAGYLVGIPLVLLLSGMLDKKAAYIVGVIGSVLFSSGPVIMRLCGIMPPNGEEILPYILSAAMFCSGFIGTIPVVLSSAMLADLSDEHDWKYGTRSEGLFFGVNAFCRKASLGLGGAVAGILIDILRFPTQALPGTVPDVTLTRFGIVYAPVMLTVLFLGLTFMRSYNLSKQRHSEILKDINQRRFSDDK